MGKGKEYKLNFSEALWMGSDKDTKLRGEGIYRYPTVFTVEIQDMNIIELQICMWGDR